jgi:hypothetical protein
MRKYFPRYDDAVSHIHMTLQLLYSEFPNIWEKFDFLFYQCTKWNDETKAEENRIGRGQVTARFP